MNTPLSIEALKLWDQFIVGVEGRLNQGRQSYGDDSFKTSPLSTVSEIQEELLDVVGWSFILWTKLERINDAIRREFNPDTTT